MTKTLCQLHHQLVAFLVTERFINAAEVIDIEVQQGQPMACTLSPQQGLLETIEEKVPVDKTGGDFAAQLTMGGLGQLVPIPEAFHGPTERPVVQGLTTKVIGSSGSQQLWRALHRRLGTEGQNRFFIAGDRQILQERRL